MVVHLDYTHEFGSSKKCVYHLVLGLITQTSIIFTKCMRKAAKEVVAPKQGCYDCNSSLPKTIHSKLITLLFFWNRETSTIIYYLKKNIISCIGPALWPKLSFHIYLVNTIQIFKLENSRHFQLVSRFLSIFSWGNRMYMRLHQLKVVQQSSSSTWAGQFEHSCWVATSSSLPAITPLYMYSGQME